MDQRGKYPLKLDPGLFKARKRTSRIVLHALDTPNDWPEDMREIDRWHREENGWKAIGYHYVIFRDGTITPGRPLDVIGAHCVGWNADSVGIALSGGKDSTMDTKFEDLYTEKQAASLSSLCYAITRLWPGIPVKGHRDHPKAHRTCPGFDAGAWWTVERMNRWDPEKRYGQG